MTAFWAEQIICSNTSLTRRQVENIHSGRAERRTAGASCPLLTFCIPTEPAGHLCVPGYPNSSRGSPFCKLSLSYSFDRNTPSLGTAFWNQKSEDWRTKKLYKGCQACSGPVVLITGLRGGRVAGYLAQGASVCPSFTWKARASLQQAASPRGVFPHIPLGWKTAF